jgi:hypothetical protein
VSITTGIAEPSLPRRLSVPRAEHSAREGHRYVESRGSKMMGIPDEVFKLISSSGNSFHAKVTRWFSGSGWHVIVSPYYMDQTQNKAREIDLIAEKLWIIRDVLDKPLDYLAVRLFIECKFVPSFKVVLASPFLE